MYLFSKRPGQAVRPTQRPTQCVTGFFFSPEQCGQSVNLTTHLYLIPKLRMSGALLLFPLDVFMACVGKDNRNILIPVTMTLRVLCLPWRRQPKVEEGSCGFIE